MKAVALVAAAAVLGAAGSAGAKSLPLYGLQVSPQGNTLSRLDGERLAPVGPRVRLAGFGQAWSLDGARARLVAASREEPPRLRFVDLQRMRVEGTVELGRSGTVTGTAWAAGRVLATVARPLGPATVVAVDPDTRRVVARRQLAGDVVRGAVTHAGFVLLLAPRERLGAPSVALVDSRLRVRSVRVARVTAGSRQSGEGEDFRVTLRQPAFAVDRTGLRAHVLAPGAPPATVDLRTFRVTYAAARALTAPAKRIEGWSRSAAWLGERLVYWGHDYAEDRSSALGAWLVDPATWQVRSLDERAGYVRTEGGWAFAFSGLSTGLRVYGLLGGLRMRALPSRQVGWVQVSGNRALVTFSGPGERAAVLDLADGRVLRRLTSPPQLLTGRSGPLWG